MPCPTFQCQNPECHRVHECNRGDKHPDDGMHIEYLAHLDRTVRQPGIVRPSAVFVGAIW